MSLTVRDAVRKWGTEYLAICGLAKYFPSMNSQSHVFFVDGTSTVGNDSAADYGQFPDAPLLTITKAISLCTTQANDYIFILNYPATAPAETWPIAIGKERVHILGVHQAMIPNFKIVSPYATADTAVFSFESYGAYCELGHLIMGCGNASSTRGAIEMHTGGLWGNWIHNCGFGLTNRSGTNAAYGISVGGLVAGEPAGEIVYGLIEDNIFGALISADGIYVPNVPFVGPNSCCGTVIRRNRFAVAGIGINVLHTVADFKSGGIFDNYFEMSSDVAGKGITFASGAKGAVHGNVGVMMDGAAPTNNPFSDAGTGMGWGINYQGGTALLAGPA